MTYTQVEHEYVNPRSIVSGNQGRYLEHKRSLPMKLQPVMFHLFGKTDWHHARRGYLQTKPVRHAELAALLQCSVRTVKRKIKELVALGELVIHSRFRANGMQLEHIYTLPKVVAFLKNLKVEDICEDLEEPASDLFNEDSSAQPKIDETGGDSDVTPLKQSSSTKNSYIRFSKEREKEEILAITGSIKYVPRILGIIRSARPGIDPDLVFRFFKEFIGRPDFILRKAWKSYLSLLFHFAKTASLPGDWKPKTGSKPDTSTGVKPSIAETKPAPAGDSDEAILRRAIHAIAPSMYWAWFDETDIEVRDGHATIRAKSGFVSRYIQNNFADLLGRAGYESSMRLRVV